MHPAAATVVCRGGRRLRRHRRPVDRLTARWRRGRVPVRRAAHVRDHHAAGGGARAVGGALAVRASPRRLVAAAASSSSSGAVDLRCTAVRARRPSHPRSCWHERLGACGVVLDGAAHRRSASCWPGSATPARPQPAARARARRASTAGAVLAARRLVRGPSRARSCAGPARPSPSPGRRVGGPVLVGAARGTRRTGRCVRRRERVAPTAAAGASAAARRRWRGSAGVRWTVLVVGIGHSGCLCSSGLRARVQLTGEGLDEAVGLGAYPARPGRRAPAEAGLGCNRRSAASTSAGRMATGPSAGTWSVHGRSSGRARPSARHAMEGWSHVDVDGLALALAGDDRGSSASSGSHRAPASPISLRPRSRRPTARPAASFANLGAPSATSTAVKTSMPLGEGLVEAATDRGERRRARRTSARRTRPCDS